MKRITLLVALFFLFVLVGCESSPSNESNESNSSSPATCTEPENPYSSGTAEYKGYEWAEEHGRSCNASSSEFTEGCEEYDSQESAYEECQAKR
jgi:hypothetical protein